MDNFYFFGYGLLRVKEVLYDLLSKNPAGGYGAVLNNFMLCYQTLSQIPQSAQQVLQPIWGNDTKVYTLKRGKGIVAGVIWQLMREDLEKIEEWDFVPEWREMIKVDVTCFDGRLISAVTTTAGENQKVAALIDGINHESNLNPVEIKQKIRQKTDNDEFRIKEIIKLRKEIAELKKSNS